MEQALTHCQGALSQFEAIGNHRYAAALENNHGQSAVDQNQLDEAETHLTRSRKLFGSFADKARCAQVTNARKTSFSC